MTMNQQSTRSKTKTSFRLLRSVLAVIVAGAQCGCVSSGDVIMPIPLIPVFYVHHAVTHIGEHVASFGEPIEDDDSSIYVEVPDSFGSKELKLFYERLSSHKFHSALSKYTHGTPVPELKFRVTLCRRTPVTPMSGLSARRVEVGFTPSLPRSSGSAPSLPDRICDAVRTECELIISAIQSAS